MRTAQSQAPETARASAGEAAASNVRTDTPNPIKAAEQTAVAPRLRDQETAENTDRAPAKDAPTGPPPAFEESPLERQARVALDPPEADATPEENAATPEDTGPDRREAVRADAEPERSPPPTPTERAEDGFAETQALADSKAPAKVDVAR